jgi:hypothetical protein
LRATIGAWSGFWADREEIEMQVGMLWFDSDQRKDLRVKIERAAGYYHHK